MPKRTSFPASQRIKKSREFQRIRDSSRKIFSKHFLMLVARSEASRPRLGITITTKIDKRAAVRNKLKRRIRYIFRTQQESFKNPVDLVVIARQNSQLCSFDELKFEIIGMLRRGGLLIDSRKEKPN